MGFDRNPHVAKATIAEQKARDAGDISARTLAWREAARLWERAAEREQSEKKRKEYEQNAERARESAEGTETTEGSAESSSGTKVPLGPHGLN